MTFISNAAGNTSVREPVTVASESMDMEEVNPYVAQEAEMAGHAFQDRIDDLDRQINSSETDPDVKIELREEKIRLEGAFEEFKEQVSELTSTIPGSGGDIRNERMAAELEGVVQDFRQLVAESYSNHGTQDVPASVCATPENTPIEPEFAKIKADMVFIEKKTTEVAENHAPDSSAGGTKEIDPNDPGQMMELFAQDQEAFYDALMELDAEDRMMMLNAAQTELQQMNQLFSMMSQFSQAMHDTAKAAINNLRV